MTLNPQRNQRRHYDNGDDYFCEGLQRIVDQNGRIGFRDSMGNIAIPPQFAFAFPFKEGYAKVTDTGHSEAVDEAGENVNYTQPYSLKFEKGIYRLTKDFSVETAAGWSNDSISVVFEIR